MVLLVWHTLACMHLHHCCFVWPQEAGLQAEGMSCMCSVVLTFAGCVAAAAVLSWDQWTHLHCVGGVGADFDHWGTK
jgi:hypothetical protein